MNKNDLEARRLATSAAKHHSVMELIAKIATVIGVVFAIHLIMDGLQQIVSAKPEAIGALAVVIEKLQINAMLGWLVGGGASLGYVYERKGKKRAIRKLAKLRHGVESDDPYHASSDLDENGHTPE